MSDEERSNFHAKEVAQVTTSRKEKKAKTPTASQNSS